MTLDRLHSRRRCTLQRELSRACYIWPKTPAWGTSLVFVVVSQPHGSEPTLNVCERPQPEFVNCQSIESRILGAIGIASCIHVWHVYPCLFIIRVSASTEHYIPVFLLYSRRGNRKFLICQSESPGDIGRHVGIRYLVPGECLHTRSYIVKS